MVPSEEALFARQLAEKSFLIAKTALISSLSLFTLLAALCLGRGHIP